MLFLSYFLLLFLKSLTNQMKTRIINKTTKPNTVHKTVSISHC